MILTEQEVIPYLQEVSDTEKIMFLIEHDHQFCFGYEVVIRTPLGNEVSFNNFKAALTEVVEENKDYFDVSGSSGLFAYNIL